MILIKKEKDFVLIKVGWAVNIGSAGIFNTFPIYWTPHMGRTPSISVPIRRINFGGDFIVKRMMCNIAFNTRPNGTDVGIRFGSLLADFLTIPAFTAGQFDTGALDPQATMRADGLNSIYIQKGVAGAGELIQVENITALLQIERDF